MSDNETSYLYRLQWHSNRKWIILSVIAANNPEISIDTEIFKTNYVHKMYPVYEVAKEILNKSKKKFVTLDAADWNIGYDMGQPDFLINHWLKKILKNNDDYERTMKILFKKVR